jgi:hypothetical protein
VGWTKAPATRTTLGKNKISVGPEDPCPIHPMARHTWGECFSNVCNKDVKNNTTTTKVNQKKEKVLEANMVNIAPGNECGINDNNSFILDGELMAEVCCFEQDTDLMEIATDATATGMSASVDSSQEHNCLYESITHHLNELTLDAFQREVNTNILSTEVIDVFTQYCDDNYSLGVSDVNLNDFMKILLKLRSTSLAIVGTIQQIKTNACGKSYLIPDRIRQL